MPKTLAETCGDCGRATGRELLEFYHKAHSPKQTKDKIEDYIKGCWPIQPTQAEIALALNLSRQRINNVIMTEGLMGWKRLYKPPRVTAA